MILIFGYLFNSLFKIFDEMGEKTYQLSTFFFPIINISFLSISFENNPVNKSYFIKI